MAELTPMMQQYFEIKNKNKDYILFYPCSHAAP